MDMNSTMPCAPKLKGIIISLFIVALAMCITAAVSKAEATYGMYIAPKITWGFFNSGYIDGMGQNNTQSGTNSIGGGIALGYNFYRFFDVPVRVEVEYLMRSDAKFDVDHDTMKAAAPKTAFFNAYLDYHNSTDFTPYMAGGVGLGFVDRETNFAWNLGTGVRYALTDQIDIDFSVKYVDFGRYTEGDYDYNLSAIETAVGIAYTF